MEEPIIKSPQWGSTTKLLVGLVIIGSIAFLINRFGNLISPLLMIFIIAYLFHPLTALIANGLGISWKAAVNILYIQTIIAELPNLLESLSGQVFHFGPFVLDMRTIELQAIAQQVLSFIQPVLGRTGNLVGTIAGGAVQIFGWTFFVLIVSYFVMSESNGLRGDLIKVDLPGYSEDFRKLGNELSRIWNAFLRGQIFIFILAFIIYVVLLSIMGVKYALGLAFLAGLAKFLPYIGPTITWIVMALVTFFQASKPFNLEAQPLIYTFIVVLITLVTDQIIDSFIAPRIMARTLKVHPAAVLVTALIAANLLGIMGVVIAAPTLATLALLGRYTIRKMFDQDPFPAWESTPQAPVGREWMTHLRQLRQLFSRKHKENIISEKENSNEQ